MNYTAQESTERGIPLTSGISWGSVPLTEQVVGVDLPPATHHRSPPQEQTGCSCDAEDSPPQVMGTQTAPC